MAQAENRRSRMPKWLREFLSETRARSAGRKAMGNDNELFHTARGIVGATGNSFSNAWKYLEKDQGEYTKSMQRESVLPPSLFVSERDRVRLGLPAPVAERCIEDYKNADAMPVRDWDIAALDETDPGAPKKKSRND